MATTHLEKAMKKIIDLFKSDYSVFKEAIKDYEKLKKRIDKGTTTVKEVYWMKTRAQKSADIMFNFDRKIEYQGMLQYVDKLKFHLKGFRLSETYLICNEDFLKKYDLISNNDAIGLVVHEDGALGILPESLLNPDDYFEKEFADKLKPLVNDFKTALREEIGVDENTNIDAVFIYHENYN